MDEDRHHAREESLGTALQRLSVARERRGPVGVLDPFEVVSEQDRLDIARPTHARRRSGLFSFAQRARDAVDE